MTKVLTIETSIFSEPSQSTALIDLVLEQLRESSGPLEVIRRNFVSQPVPHLDEERFSAFNTEENERTQRQQDLVSYSDTLISEISGADVIVLGLPMYNFGAPSSLKAYFDQIARAGHTFRYTEKGPVGMLEDRPVYVVATRGGQYRDTPNDHQVPYIKQFLGFIGLEDLRFIYAEGLAMSDARERSLELAHEQIQELAA
jgi:FMN-dependent NADH-azoreductase